MRLMQESGSCLHQLQKKQIHKTISQQKNSKTVYFSL